MASAHDATAIAHASTTTGHDRQITLSQSVENNTQISVLYMNARSLLSKRAEILAYVAIEKPDVIAITETWIKPDYLMSEFSITGYESYHKNQTYKKGGRVVCYIKSSLTAVRLETLDAEKYDSAYVDITMAQSTIESSL